MNKNNAQKLLNFMEENEGMDEAINESVEYVIAQRTKVLEEENEDYLGRMRIFENYIAEENDTIQKFIDHLKFNMELCIEEGFVDSDYDWSLEKQMIREWESELEFI